MSAYPAAGWHLLADVRVGAGSTALADIALVEAALRAGAKAARTHLLEVKLHGFGPGLGITGVALLAESHISIHSWPEAGVAAVDLFVCGPDADPQAGLAALAATLGAQVERANLVPRLGAAHHPAP